MEKLNMHTQDMAEANIEKIGQLFPNCLTERLNEKGQPETAIDFDKLKQELSKEIVEGNQERYQFTWPGKREAIRLANTPTNTTIRPLREKSVNFDNTENVYIEGDNLEVLKLLRENYLGKIKVIYIDPPYNTGNDFVYDDDYSQTSEEFKSKSGIFDNNGNMLLNNYEVNSSSNGRFHTDWLNMLYPRIKVGRDLLSNDGIMFISIDDNEVDNLRKICDEAFGRDNFVSEFVWEKKKKPSFLNANLGSKTEYIIAYAKNRRELGALSVDVTEEGKKYPFNNAGNSISELTFPADSVSFNMADCTISPQDMSEGNIITELLTEVIVRNGKNSNAFTLRGEWRYSQSKLNEIVKNGETITISKVPFRPNHIKAGGDIKKIHNLLTSSSYGIGTNEDATAEQISIFGKTFFEYTKPVSLLHFLIKSATYDTPDCYVLDYFSGSATTAQATMQLNAEDGGNRKFILVQLPEQIENNNEAHGKGFHTICDIGISRIKISSERITGSETSANLFDTSASKIDTGFRVLKLDTSNMQDVYYKPEDFSENTLFEDNVKPDRTSEDLLFQVMLECNLPLSAKIEKKTIAGKEVFNVNDGYLLACFDEDVNETVITEVAKQKPYYFIMRDMSLSEDNVADNFEQIFNAYSKDTIRKIL